MASTAIMFRWAASAGTDFGTPWAEKTTGRSVGQSSSSSTKIAPWALEGVDDELVVDDLVADVDGGAPFLQGHLDDLDRPVHPGAEAARGGKVKGEGGQVGHGAGSGRGWDRFRGCGGRRPAPARGAVFGVRDFKGLVVGV